MDMPAVCPVVGTTNNILPPDHPAFDLNKPGQVCPVTNATTDHHHNLSQHPPVHLSNTITGPSSADENHATSPSALSCPVLKKEIKQQSALDEGICPVIGPATSVLPPGHPSMENESNDSVCPVTNASLAHHKGKVIQHPNVANASTGAVCPVTGVQARA